jgi:hypothetical protein
MTVKLTDDQKIDHLLELAGVPRANYDARRWIADALKGTRAIAAASPQPSPAGHNKALDVVKRSADSLIVSLERLRRYSSAHEEFWRFAGFGPIYGNEFERPNVISTLKNIRAAAGKARVGPGRPKKLRKQVIVNLALAFCTRVSEAEPSSDVKNFFPPFAERFFEYSTGLSVEGGGRGIGRQIKAALHRQHEISPK